MKLVTQIRLFPDAAQAQALEVTLRACNTAASKVAQVALEHRAFGRQQLQRRVYRDLKAGGLSAQPALHVIRKVADAYASSRNRETCCTFHWNAAQPFDDRCLSWQLDAQTVSIWTLHGRLRGVRFGCSPWQLTALRQHRKGETDLAFRGGKWLLIATCDVPESPAHIPTGMIGVDLGIANIATTSAGRRYSGSAVNRIRHRNHRLRGKLQRKGSKGAKRLLKQRSRKESRFVANTNHLISKRIVAEAQRTGRGITLEQLEGIRGRVRLRAPQRAALHSWPFRQLSGFIQYKAQRLGVLVVTVDPAYTSQECSRCGHIDRRNRPSRSSFVCTSCGFAEHADVNAAVNLEVRGRAAVNQPHAATRVTIGDTA